MDTTKKNSTKYRKKYEQLTSCVDTSFMISDSRRRSSNQARKENFEKEYKKLFGREAKTEGFYHWILNELRLAVSGGDIDSLIKLDTFIGYINDIENKAALKNFYDSRKNPIKDSNLVIIACKYNKVKILKYIFNNSRSLNILSLDIGKSAVAFDDQDEERHNAFYYSIRSNNVELLDTLINEWPGDYFATHSEQLEEVLSSAYEELKLKNVSLTDEIQIYIENKLVNLRFFSDNFIGTKSLNKNPENVKERIKLVLQNINLLKTEYSNMKKVDDKFLFVIKFIAQNIHILKRQLKSTYDKIPWEEMEFCLTSFVSSYVKQQQLNLFYRAVLNKRKVLNFLENFSQILGKVKKPEMFTDFPRGKRQEIVAEIINNYPQFEQLYTDYQQIRDICSLQKMKDYVQLASSIDPEERQGQLVMTRILQVVGEHLKNSLESPKLSDFTNELLLLSLPKNTRQVVIDLRNSLSHAHSLARRTEIEKDMNVKFFIGLQNDIKKIGDDINNILHKEKMKVMETLFEKIGNSDCFDKMKEVAEVFTNTGNEFDIIEEEFQTMERDEFEILFKELNNIITEKTEDEQQQFDRIEYIINASKNKWKNTEREYLAIFESLRNFTQIISERKNDNNIIKEAKLTANRLKNITVPTESHDLEEIVELLWSGFCSIKCRVVDYDNVKSIICKMYYIIKVKASNIDRIEGLLTKLIQKAPVIPVYKQKKDLNTKKKKYNDDLHLKLAELKNVLTDSKLTENSIEDLLLYKTNKRLQLVIEMLVLDIMSILDEGHLENNSSFLDDNSSLLTGKSLRNHLAHDNTITNILSSDPSLNIVLNATKLVSENITENKRKIGKSTKNDYLKVTNKCSQSLVTIVNQQRMFAALEEGHFEGLKSYLRQGADIHARNSNLWTALHFAAKGPNLEIVKFVLSHDLDMNVKNVNGQNPLHVAAANGRTNIVKYFVEKLGFDVNVTDNYEKTPLHVAAQSNHKDTVKILLKNGSKVDMQDTGSYVPLHHAVMNNCIDIVKILMVQSADFDVNERFVTGMTVLHIAAQFGYSELLNLFLRNGANVSARDEFNATPLHLAARNGHLEVVNALISKKATVNARYIDGGTPLHFAVESGQEAIAKVLLKDGADANVSKIDNFTPLHFAAINGCKEIVLDLLEHKANAEVTTVTDLTPLHFAAMHGHLEIVNILIDHGVKVHSKDKDEATALHYAASEGHKEIIELLLKSEASLNVRTISGLTPLHAAAASACNKDVIELLMRNKAVINFNDKNGMTPLHIAAVNGCINNALLLIKNEAEVDARNADNMTPLHIAVQNGHKDFVALLLKRHADVNIRSSAGTPLDLAINADHKEIVEILLANGAVINDNTRNPTPFLTAVVKNQKEIVELFIAKGVNVRLEGSKALAIAVVNGYREIVWILLRKEVPVNQKYDDDDTLLHFAARGGHKEILNALILRGADVNAVRKFNTTPLHIAVQEGYDGIVETLLKNGADINAKDKVGTPLHVAAVNGHCDIVQILVDNKARIDIEDEKNRIALELAVAHGHLEVVKVLLLTNMVDVNTKYNGRTLVHIASQEPNLKMIKYLIDEGTDINAKDESSLKAIHVAAMHGHKDIVRYFLSKGLSVDEFGAHSSTLLHYAVMKCRLEVVKYLIGEGADVNAKNTLDVTPLHIAVKENCKDVIKVLLVNGAMYNAVNKMNELPSDLTNDERIVELLTATGKLFQAVNRDDVNNVERYIEAGAFVNARDAENVTLLHYAACKGYDKIVDILLESAVNPNAISNGFTPLHYAVKYSHLKVVTLLLSKAAMYNALSSTDKKTPLDLATDENIIRLFKLISKSFEQVKSDDAGVIDELNRINDLDTIKAVMNVRNEENESLVVAAIHSNFTNVEKLKKVSQGNISYQIDRGLMELERGNWKMALNCFRHALEKRSLIFELDNPGILDIKIHVTRVLCKRGRDQEALQTLEEIYLKQTEMLGLHSTDTLKTRCMIALILHRLGRYEEAYNIYQDVYQTQKKILELNHPDTLMIKIYMAAVLNNLGRYDEVLNINRTVFEKWKNTLGINNIKTLHAQTYTAVALANKGNSKDALKILEEVHNKMTLMFGINHPDTLRTLSAISDVIFKQNRPQKAMERYQELVNSQEIVLGSNHPETLHTHCKILMVLFKQGKWISLLKVCGKIVPRIKNVFPPTHPILLRTLTIMEDCNSMLKFHGWDISDFLQIQEISTAANDGDVETVQRLLEDGMNLNDTDTEGRTPLHYAASTGQINVVNILLRNGADIDVSSGDGETPLHVATSNDHRKIIDILLQQVNRDRLNKFINAKTIVTGNTSLHIAATIGLLDIVYCLLGHGAIYNIHNKKGETPSDLSKHQTIVDLLKIIEDLFRYAENGSNEIISKLRVIKELSSDEFVAVTNARNDQGYTLLQVTTLNRRKNVAYELLKMLK